MAEQGTIANSLRRMMGDPATAAPFSDARGWQQRELAGEIAPGRQGAVAAPQRQLDMPESGNIEDRRGESLLTPQFLISYLSGFTPQQWSEAWAARHGKTDPASFQLPDTTDDSLAARAGYNDIAQGVHSKTLMPR